MLEASCILVKNWVYPTTNTRMGVLAERMGVLLQLAPHENNYWNKSITLNIIKLFYFNSLTLGVVLSIS